MLSIATQLVLVASSATLVAPGPPSPAAPSSSTVGSTAGTEHGGLRTVFINFEGGMIDGCEENDPATNCTTITYADDVTVLPFSGGVGERALIVAMTREVVSPFGVTVTDQRPEGGGYDMVMVGDIPELAEFGAFIAVTPSIDCGDGVGPQIMFATEANDNEAEMSETIVRSLGLSWGLDYVDAISDVMYPEPMGSNKAFRDECFATVDEDGEPMPGECNAVHVDFCDTAQQNSFRELRSRFGEGQPDVVAPTVSVVFPEDGSVLDEGDFELVVRLEDDLTPALIDTVVTLDGDALSEAVESEVYFASPGDLVLPITRLPDGEYSLSVDARDESGNPASEQIVFVVGDPAMGDDGADGSGTAGGGEDGDGSTGGLDGDGSGGEASTGAGAGGSSTGGGMPAEPSQGSGCSCRATDRPGSGAALGLMVLLGLRRRRSSHSRR